jgi:DtxR family Mn-dependent transcriptional regulator
VEDYLEAMLRLEGERGLVRAKELAERLRVSNASISSIMPRLERLGLVTYERYAPLRLTSLGRRMARAIVRREDVLVAFFGEILGIPPARAREEACRMEHAISPASLRRLEAFLMFLRKRPHLLEGWVGARPGDAMEAEEAAV